VKAFTSATAAATSTLTTDLTRALPGSFVVARESAFTYKGKAIDARQIGRELQVRYVLEGSALQDSDQIRINAQLVDAQVGNEIWAERFDTARSEVLRGLSVWPNPRIASRSDVTIGPVRDGIDLDQHNRLARYYFHQRHAAQHCAAHEERVRLPVLTCTGSLGAARESSVGQFDVR
jgi:hypothetical protein